MVLKFVCQRKKRGEELEATGKMQVESWPTAFCRQALQVGVAWL